MTATLRSAQKRGDVPAVGDYAFASSEDDGTLTRVAGGYVRVGIGGEAFDLGDCG